MSNYPDGCTDGPWNDPDEDMDPDAWYPLLPDDQDNGALSARDIARMISAERERYLMEEGEFPSVALAEKMLHERKIIGTLDEWRDLYPREK